MLAIVALFSFSCRSELCSRSLRYFHFLVGASCARDTCITRFRLTGKNRKKLWKLLKLLRHEPS